MDSSDHSKAGLQGTMNTKENYEPELQGQMEGAFDRQPCILAEQLLCVHQ